MLQRKWKQLHVAFMEFLLVSAAGRLASRWSALPGQLIHPPREARSYAGHSFLLSYCPDFARASRNWELPFLPFILYEYDRLTSAALHTVLARANSNCHAPLPRPFARFTFLSETSSIGNRDYDQD
jgi:hypothetical protein